MAVPEKLKQLASAVVAQTAPQCRYASTLFLLGHMRCGSTAVSNILVSRRDVSGYGEAHVAYSDENALGRLLINQWRRGGWKPGADWLFDKILHDRYDAKAKDEFFLSRALFVARAPEDSVRSIRALFANLRSTEYDSDEKAGRYLAARMTTLLGLWERFPPDRRLALTHASIIADPECAVSRLSDFTGFNPPLVNRYDAGRVMGEGAGDPMQAHRFQRIEAGIVASSVASNRRPLDLDPGILDELIHLYQMFQKLEDNVPR